MTQGLYHYEMDDDGRKKKGIDAVFGIQKKRNSGKNEHGEMLERSPSRRQLETYDLLPPDYIIDPQILLEKYVEKQVRFAGIIPSVPTHIDSTSRTDILRYVDKGQIDRLILTLRQTGFGNDVAFSLSVNNIKVSRRDGFEDVIIRVPIHQIATVCYIQDDNNHILALKYGDPEEVLDVCKLAVFYCNSRATSEEICSLIGQCFQLIYTDATMQYLDRNIIEGANGDNIFATRSGSDSSNVTPTTRGDGLFRPSFRTRSISNMGESNASTASTQRPSQTQHRPQSYTRSESEMSTSSEMLQDYIKRMQNDLNPSELRQFASIMNDYFDKDFATFCEKVYELYGQRRKELLIGMRDFIPEKQTAYFEGYLRSVDVVGPMPSSRNNSRKHKRPDTASDALTSFSNSLGSTRGAAVHDNMDLEKMFRDMSNRVEDMENSVEVDTNPNAFMPHR